MILIAFFSVFMTKNEARATEFEFCVRIDSFTDLPKLGPFKIAKQISFNTHAHHSPVCGLPGRVIGAIPVAAMLDWRNN